MTDDDGHDDPLEVQLHAWARTEIARAPSVAVPPVNRNQRKVSPRRRARPAFAIPIAAVAVAGIVTISVVLSGSDTSESPHHRALPGSSRAAAASLPGSAAATHGTGSAHPSTVIPSPPPPPFGYCGGLRSVADARYIVAGGAAVALVSAVISGPGSPIRHVKVVRTMPVSDVRLLAGHLPDGPLTDIDSSPLATGRYLIVVGDTGRGGYFPALGFYGVYAIAGAHAYRTCYDFSGKPAHLVRVGITTIDGLSRIFAKALRTTRP